MAEYIEREAVLNGVALYMAENAYLNDTALDVLKMVGGWLTDAPAADVVEVVHGELNFARDDGILMGECSICGTVAIATQAAMWNFCPNCGADMREVNDAN